MTRDITASLRWAVANAKQWSREEVRRVLTEFVRAGSHRSLDWDEDAGEAWGRVVDDEGVVVMVSARMPLIVVRDSAARNASRSGWGAEMVSVTSLEDEHLKVDKAALVEAFPELAAQLDNEVPEFSPDHFAAQDLWFLTV